MKGREEKNKKRVIHLYAGKDNKLTILPKNKKRVIHLYAGKDNKLAILPRSTIRREEKRREDGMRSDPPVNQDGYKTLTFRM